MNKFVINTKMVGIEDFGSVHENLGPMIDLTIGEPSFKTHQLIKDASIRALDENITKYPPSLGFEEVREAISKFEKQHSNIDYKSDEVLVVNGGTEGLAAALAVLLNEGDEVIVPTPAYAAYESLIEMNRGKYVAVDTSDSDFVLTGEKLAAAITEKSKIVMLTSPNNPTGTIYSSAELKEIVDVLIDKEIYVVMDATYGHLVFDQAHDMSELERIRERVVFVYSLSKTYAMTGWRLGYVIADKPLIKYLNQWHHCTVTGVSSFSQFAILEALKLDVSDVVSSYRERVNYVVSELKDMGFEVVAPQGAFYVFPSLKGFNMDSKAFVDLCARNGLKVISGHFFGSSNHFRISCCYSMETIVEGMNCLRSIVSTLK